MSPEKIPDPRHEANRALDVIVQELVQQGANVQGLEPDINAIRVAIREQGGEERTRAHQGLDALKNTLVMGGADMNRLSGEITIVRQIL